MKTVRYLAKSRTKAFVVVVALSAGLILSAAVVASSAVLLSGTPAPTATPGVSVIAQNGFGDRNNSWAWAMDWFKGKLYVGTGRDELCVEFATTQFFYPQDKGYYNTNPSPNVRCTKSPYDLPLRAEIWQYTPGSGTTTTTTVTKTTADGTSTTTTSIPSTGTWKMVFRSPVERNPMAKGKTVARDFAYRGMVTWRNPATGQQALFAAGVTPDEYIPPLLKSHPPVILRSFDGIHWTTLHLPSVVVHFPNGNVRPMGFRSLLVWDNHLFVTATPDITGDGSVFEVTNPWSNHPGLRQVSGPEYDVFETAKFAGALYIGTGNKEIGYAVYRAFKYTKTGYLPFQQVVGDGAGRGSLITSVVSMHTYRDRLYVGSSGWHNQNALPLSEMIRIAPDGQWTLVAGDPRNLPDGQTMYPVSGLYDGFFSPFTAHFWRMANQDGGLFVGTNDWAYLLQEDKQYAWLQETVLSGVLGFNVWATCDGDDWFAVTRDAFGTSEYNFGGRTLVNGGSHDQDLFIGSANQAQGATIFDDQEEACSGVVGNNRKALARPAGLETDALRHGTLLTWDRSAGAGSYDIERAPFESITIAVKPPPTLPSGWTMEDATPTIASPGAPGSVTVTLSVPGAFTSIGTTESSDFVDHSSGRYVYEVVAKSGPGRASQPSNVEVAPFAGPPATFGELKSALDSPTPVVAPPGASKATEVRAALASRSAESRLQSLLGAAEAAADAGKDALARRDVQALAAAAGDNDTLAAAAARVVRRLEYASIAGQP
jgi:hypothetical protein